MPKFLEVSDKDAARAVLYPAAKTVFVEDFRDGVLTDNEIITAAFADVEDGGEVQFGQGVEYETTGDLVISLTKENVLVNGQGATITASGNTALSIRGSRYATTNTTLTAAIASRTATLTVASTTATASDGSGWAAGDMVRVYSDSELWSPNYSTSGTGPKAEMGRVASVPDSTTITLDARTWDTYTISGATVTVQRYAPVKNLTIRDLNLVGGYADGSQVGLDVRYFDGLRLENIVAKGFGLQAIKAVEGIGVTGVGCVAEDTMGSSNGYGMVTTTVHHVKWNGCQGLRNRHTFDAFQTRDLQISNCTAAHDRSSGFSTHASTDVVKIVNCTARECGGGIIVRGRNNTISGNHVLGSKFIADSSSQTYRNGITIGQGGVTNDGISGQNLIIDKNVIDLSGPTYGVYPIEGDYSGLTSGIEVMDPLTRAKITGNIIHNFPTHGIWAHGDTNTDVEISGNYIDCSQHVGVAYKSGIYLEPWDDSASNVHTGIVIRDNVIGNTTASTHSGVRVSGGSSTSPRTDSVIIVGNRIAACQTAPIFLGGTYLTTSPAASTFAPRTPAYYGSAVYVHGNTTVDAVSVSCTPANHTTAPYIHNNVNGGNKLVVSGTTSDTSDSGAQFLGALDTGLLKNTTSTGVLSVASRGVDYFAAGNEMGARMRSGLYYAMPGTGTTLATTLNRMYVTPLFIPRTVSLDRIAINVTAASGSAGSLALLGIYADIADAYGGLPGDLVSSSTGSVATDAIAFVEATISVTLSPGLYWLAMVTQTATCTVTAVSSGSQTIGHNAAAIAVGRNSYFQSSVSDSLPSSFTGNPSGQGTGPLIQVRVA